MTLRSLFVDLNSYFASVEQVENDDLRGRPVGVCPVLADSGCCIAASIEAKRFGVRTGTLVRDARERCPEIVLVEARPALYVRYHHAIVAAIERCLPVASIGSIDEMACDLVGSERQRDRAVELAKAIKTEIAGVGRGGLRCSVGIAPNRFLAKTGTDMQKPDGLVVLESSDLPQALFGLELSDFCGIGPAMLRRVNDHGIHTVEQLCAASPLLLRKAWGGVEGERFHARLHGAWHVDAEHERGSVGHSHVLPPRLRNRDGAEATLKKLLQKAAMRLRSYGLVAGALAVKIRYVGAPSWKQWRRLDATDDTRRLLHALVELLATRRDPRPPLSVSVTLVELLDRSQSTASLFDETPRQHALNGLIDRINQRFGNNRIYYGGSQDALDAAPMRIPFNRIPDLESEADAEKNELWLKRTRQARVLAEAEHRRHEQRRR